MSEYLQKIVYLSQEDYNTLAGGGTAHGETGLHEDWIYLTENGIGNTDLSDVQHIAGRLVEGHIALHGLVDPDTQLVHRDGGGVEHGAGLIPLRPALTLVGLAGHTTAGTEDKGRIDVGAEIGMIWLSEAQLVEHILGHNQHRVLGIFLNVEFIASGAIDIDIHAGLAGYAERKAHLLGVRRVLAALVVEAEAQNRRELIFEALSGGVSLHLLSIIDDSFFR